MIAQALSISNAGATKLIDRLVKRGWVDREPRCEDRRERRLTLTERGLILLRMSIEAGTQAMDKVVMRMTEKDLAAMTQGTRTFLHAAADQATELGQVCLRCGWQHDSTCAGAELFMK